MDDSAPAPARTITAVSIPDAAWVLSRAGATVTEDQIRADVAAGAPTNPDGTINLINLAAWYVQQRSDGDP